jgi:THO complex subunit 2
MAKDQNARAKSVENRHERSEGAMKPDVQQKKSTVASNGSDILIQSSSVQGKSSVVARAMDEPPKPVSDEGVKVSTKSTSEFEVSVSSRL